jgi:hypothetical protein
LKAPFKYFNSFIAAEPNSIDVLLCDEAHRIRHTSANRFTPAAKRTGRLQVDELISVARVPVFLLDEHQVMRPGESGRWKRSRRRRPPAGCASTRSRSRASSGAAAAHIRPLFAADETWVAVRRSGTMPRVVKIHLLAYAEGCPNCASK